MKIYNPTLVNGLEHFHGFYFFMISNNFFF